MHFFSSQFGYCPLVWMFHNRRYNNKVNRLHDRMLRIVYKDYKSSFAELFSEDKSFNVHHRNVQKLQPFTKYLRLTLGFRHFPDIS